MLTGAIRPTTGSVRLAGLDPYLERDAFSRQVGVLFAEDNLYKRMSVLEICSSTAACTVCRKRGRWRSAGTGWPGRPRPYQCREALPGPFQAAGTGTGNPHNPQVLLLADPFAGCEQASITLISQVVRRQAEAGAAVLIFTQDTSQPGELCDTVYRLDQGRIVESYDPREEQQRKRPFMVPARSKDKIILVDPAEILYVFAQDDRAYLQTIDGRLPTQFTLAELEKRLSRSGFFRAHRAYLVNLQQVKEVIPYTRDSFSLRLKDAAGTEIPLSKSAERELRELLGY